MYPVPQLRKGHPFPNEAVLNGAEFRAEKLHIYSMKCSVEQ